MSLGRKRQSTGSTCGKKQALGQILFPPRYQTVWGHRGPPVTKPVTRQQTLTQIDFVLRNCPNDADDVDLNYIHHSPTRERKRRKLSPEEASAPMVLTRAARKRTLTTEDEVESLPDDRQRRARILSPQNEPLRVPSNQLLPPKTPRTTRKTEIPSSQSPADTPLSTRSRRSLRHISASPLKERSANISMSKELPGIEKEVKKQPRLEIADTFQSERWNSQPSFQATSTPLLPSQTTMAISQGPTRTSSARLSHEDSVTSASRLSGPSKSAVRSSSSLLKHQSKAIKSEIEDSDGETEGDEFVEDGFDVGVDTQVILSSSAEMASSSQIRKDHSTASTVDEGAIDGTPPERIASHTSPQDASSRVTDSQNDEPATSQHANKPRSTKHHHQPTPNEAKQQPLPQTPHLPRSRSPSFSPSAQLTTDLNRHTQPSLPPLLLETESQFETSWRDHSSPLSLSPPPLPTILSPAHEPTPRHITSPAPHPPIRSSQATTVDITQSSPLATRTPLSLSTQPQPQPQPQLQADQHTELSSPLQPPGDNHNDADADDTEIWDGKILTESQLLPDSLMREAVPPPPMRDWDLDLDSELSQESWKGE
ncbi:hypothetical protein MMC20_006030 [Loxospora ochrophaea]|nr:hypothetical protein [Loxospora ochrophaea]